MIQELGIKSAPVDVQRLIRHKGLQLVGSPLEDSVSGALISRPNRAYIAVNSLHHKNRQRFTMAHELGHFVLHSDEPAIFIDNSFITFRAEIGEGHSADPREMEANEFAACVLMPEQMLKRDVVADDHDHLDEAFVSVLAKRYAVSEQAMTIRLTRLGLLV